jgi:hypothetical protein
VLKNRPSILLPLCAVLGAVLACTISFGDARRYQMKVVEVDADNRWTATGVLVSEGDKLTIRYLSGEWSPWPGGQYDAIGSGGDPRCRCNVMDGVSHAALIGKIGANDPFLVGGQYSHRVGESGELFLGINDMDLYDNSGSLQVRVEVD